MSGTEPADGRRDLSMRRVRDRKSEREELRMSGVGSDGSTSLAGRWSMVTALAVSLLALVAAAGVALPAEAATIYSYAGKIGDTGSATGQFSADNMPKRMAVHEKSGKVLVADPGNGRIQVFTPTQDGAAFAFSLTIAGAVALAVDQANGNLYVSTSSAIRKLNPDNEDNPTSYSDDPTFVSPTVGSGVGQIGGLPSGLAPLPPRGDLAVDPTNSNLLVADNSKNIIQRFGSDGHFISSFDGCAGDFFPGYCGGLVRPAFAGISSMAVTSTGDIIVSDVNGSAARVDRFSGAGVLQATLSSNNNPVPNDNLAGLSGVAVAVNPATDEVMVSSSIGPAFSPTPGVAKVFQFANDQLVGSFTAPSDFAGYVQSMAARGDSPGRLWVLAGSNPAGADFFGRYRVPWLHAFDAVTPTTVSFGAVTSVTATTASFSGEINPNGGAAKWVFRYRLVGASQWLEAPAPRGDAGSGTSAVPVTVTATNLEPNSQYEVKLVGLAGAFESETAAVTFDTAPQAPIVESGFGADLDNDAVTLTGGINPRNAAVTYHFEWGVDANYGQSAPAVDGSLSAGRLRRTVTAPVSGLEPSTDYHFRLVAENEFGQRTEGPDSTFTTLASSRSRLQGKRGFEAVSRFPTGDVRLIPGTVSASEDGNRALYQTSPTDPTQPGFDIPTRRFLGQRGDEGWSFRTVDFLSAVKLEFDIWSTPSLDHRRVVSVTSRSFDPDDQNDAADLYRVEPDGSLTWLTRSELVEPGQPQTDAVGISLSTIGYMSADGGVVVFLSKRKLVEEDPFPSGAAHRIYKWDHGDLSLVSVLPNQAVASGWLRVDAVSRDGSTVVWTQSVTEDGLVQGQGNSLFVKTDGRDTAAVGNGWFRNAASDGSLISFIDAGKAFVFDVAGGVRRDIALGASVRDLMAASADGRVVYYSSNVVHDTARSPIDKLPSSDGGNVYRATLNGAGSLQSTEFVASVGASGGTRDLSATNSQGSVLAFGSGTAITGQPTAGGQQLFVYDEISRSLRCASCPSDGSPPAAGNVNNKLSVGGQAHPLADWYLGSPETRRRFVSSEGTVFFTTNTRLVSSDENAVRDVYEFRNGSVRLVSSGAWDAEAAMFETIGLDGETAFITMSSAIDPRDDEPGVRKAYAVRVGGGFDRPPTPTAPCDADDCQGSATAPPPTPAMDSAAADGDGDVKSVRASTKPLLRVGRVKAGRGTAATLHIRVSGAGRVSVSGGPVRRASVSVRKAGSHRITVTLNARSMRALKKRGRLRAGVRVTFTSRLGQTASKKVFVNFKKLRVQRDTKATKGGRR